MLRRSLPLLLVAGISLGASGCASSPEPSESERAYMMASASWFTPVTSDEREALKVGWNVCESMDRGESLSAVNAALKSQYGSATGSQLTIHYALEYLCPELQGEAGVWYQKP